MHRYGISEDETAEIDDEFSPHRPTSFDHASNDPDGQSRRGSTPGAALQKLYVGPLNRKEIQHWKGANPWSVSCCCSPCVHPLYCLSAQICLPWRVFQQRKALLFQRDEDYQCCAGICGKQFTEPCAPYMRGNADLCLGAEVICFPCWALFGNRWMIMQHYNLENDYLDNVNNFFTCPLSVVSYFWQDDVVENCVYLPMPLCGGCVMAQQQMHMDMYGYPVGQNVTIRRDMR